MPTFLMLALVYCQFSMPKEVETRRHHRRSSSDLQRAGSLDRSSSAGSIKVA